MYTRTRIYMFLLLERLIHRYSMMCACVRAFMIMDLHATSFAQVLRLYER